MEDEKGGVTGLIRNELGKNKTTVILLSIFRQQIPDCNGSYNAFPQVTVKSCYNKNGK